MYTSHLTTSFHENTVRRAVALKSLSVDKQRDLHVPSGVLHWGPLSCIPNAPRPEICCFRLLVVEGLNERDSARGRERETRRRRRSSTRPPSLPRHRPIPAPSAPAFEFRLFEDSAFEGQGFGVSGYGLSTSGADHAIVPRTPTENCIYIYIYIYIYLYICMCVY